MAQRQILFLPPVKLAKVILSERAREILEDLGEVIWNDSDRDYTQEELANLLPDAEAVVTSWGSPSFTPELLEKAPKLRIVGHAAGSVKHLMPKEGYDRGIVVLSAASVIADPVAEYTLWAMLHMQRNLSCCEKVMKEERDWRWCNEGTSHELFFKRVGLVSASMVGRRVIELLRPFHCDVMVYDPYLSDEDAATLGVRRVSLLELFATSDIVSVHAPTTPETREMIKAEHFKAMREGALFINTARSWVVDQAAMVEELRAGRIRAVIDVFDQEPLPPEDPLRTMDNVFLTPHVAGYTVEARLRQVEAIAEDMARFFAGEPPRLAVSWERLRIMA